MGWLQVVNGLGQGGAKERRLDSGISFSPFYFIYLSLLSGVKRKGMGGHTKDL